MIIMKRGIYRTSRPRPRSRNIVLIGHLSNKSSVYSPTSMSRMSQDLVYNHMKSHYQRIASAKATVDTSAPKSLKLIMKEKDRKRQESFRNSFQAAAVRSSPSQKHSERKHKDTSDIQGETSCSSGTFEVMDETKREHMENMLMDEMRENSHRTNEIGGQGVRENSHRTNKIGGQFNGVRENSHRTNEIGGQSNGVRENSHRTNEIGGQSNGVRGNSDRTNKIGEQSQYNYKSSRKQVLEQSLRIDPSLRTPFDHRVYSSTPRPQTEDELQDDDVARHPTLQMSNISFSYKTPPSPRKTRSKKRSEEIIWTEEQKYLHFISEVTTDVLARGVFSNRVLNRVFESHIEKRKDDLDEEHMREMINQLKQDLDITDC